MKPYACTSMLLDIVVDKIKHVLVLPVGNLSTFEDNGEYIVHVYKPNKVFAQLEGVKKVIAMCLLYTDDPFSEAASHNIGLGYFDLRILMRDAELEIKDDKFIFKGKNLDFVHMRPDR